MQSVQMMETAYNLGPRPCFQGDNSNVWNNIMYTIVVRQNIMLHEVYAYFIELWIILFSKWAYMILIVILRVIWFKWFLSNV